MSKEEEFDILNELEKVVNEAGKGITDAWKDLQVRLLQSSRALSEQIFDHEKEVKAVLCVGYRISEGQYDEDDNVERVGPAKEEYAEIHPDSGYARMAPAVGVKTSADMMRFLEDKTLVCSLYEVSNYVSLFMHIKYNKSEMIAMTTPAGLAVHLERPNQEPYAFHLMFQNEDDDLVKKHMGVLSEKQVSVLKELCEAQCIAPELKRKHPKMWELMLETIKENGSNPFLEGKDMMEGDE
jgi:hypothetical protein